MQEVMKNCIQNIRVLPFLLDAVYNIKERLAPHAEQLHDHILNQSASGLSEMPLKSVKCFIEITLTCLGKDLWLF